jgi:hypothetical protein
MLAVKVKIIAPDEDTRYLVGPEGLVWTQPATGEPYILAARNENERQAAAGFVGELLAMGAVPYGLPLNQRAIVACFGGSPIRDCVWMPHAEAPAPTGEEDDTLPAQAAVITP